MPVAKHAMQLLQVVQRGAGRGQNITPIIPKHVLLELEAFASRWHKLPHTCRFGAGDRLRVKCAFYEWQQGQLGRHIAPFQLFHNMKKVFA